MKVKLTVSYDGTNYCGWQVQPNGVTIQKIIEDAIEETFNEKVSLKASGRTDAGVHAKGQVASFILKNEKVSAENIAKALNTKLPSDIKIIKSEKVEDSFDANLSAKRKTYCYSMYNSDVILPLIDRYSFKIDDRIKVKNMKKVARLFKGKHDFKAFNASKGGAVTTERIIYSSKIKVKENNLLFFVTGNGFLYNMVRIMAGVLYDAGLGKITKKDVVKMLKTGKRPYSVKTLPAKGLTLYNVKYQK